MAQAKNSGGAFDDDDAAALAKKTIAENDQRMQRMMEKIALEGAQTALRAAQEGTHRAATSPALDPNHPLNKGRRLVRVHHNDMAEENRLVPISVNDCSGQARARVEFVPGQAVFLSQTQIDILKDAERRTEFAMPPGSGCYQDVNPLASAESENPGFQASWDVNGQVVLTQVVKRFIVEPIVAGINE